MRDRGQWVGVPFWLLNSDFCIHALPVSIPFKPCRDSYSRREPFFPAVLAGLLLDLLLFGRLPALMLSGFGLYLSSSALLIRAHLPIRSILSRPLFSARYSACRETPFIRAASSIER